MLREFEERDWRAVHEYACDPKVVRYMQWGPNSEAQTRSFIRRALSLQEEKPRWSFEFAVVLTNTERLVGACGIRVSNPEAREADIGYVFDRPFWGQGYGSEAARRILRFGFGELGLHRIYAIVDPRNLGSIRVLEKIGMKREGRLREHRLVRGEWCDSLVYAILEGEWRAGDAEGPGNH